jgi:hypothetical protein
VNLEYTYVVIEEIVGILMKIAIRCLL